MDRMIYADVATLSGREVDALGPFVSAGLGGAALQGLIASAKRRDRAQAHHEGRWRTLHGWWRD